MKPELRKIIPIKESTAESSTLYEFYKKNSEETFLSKRFASFAASTQKILKPPFPKYLQVETSNICNHSCSFCAYNLMERKKSVMNMQLFSRLVQEAYILGSREIGLFSGSEPLTCKNLEDQVSFCRSIGYEYIYISTNGALATHDRLKRLLDAGVSSIKFSINGGTRESYFRVHKKDDFEKVLDNLDFVSRYRKSLPDKVFLAVSFVEHEGWNEGTYEHLVELLREKVDEMVFYKAANQSGQMPDLPDPVYRDCDLPFNKVHITVEGYLRACCNDYENLLVLEDLNTMSLHDAWWSDRFTELRHRHLNNQLSGILCGNCIRGEKAKPLPLNPTLLKCR
jgi:pyruvate-formate lyase-activating enzyme